MRKIILNIISPWVILGGLLLAFILTTAICGFFYLTKSPLISSGIPTASLTKIPVSTSTVPGPIFTKESTEPTANTPPSPEPGNIVLGAYIQISGTGGDGLNLRNAPGIGSQVQYLGFESEVFEVRDGPQEVDGLTWWYLVGFYDDSRNGWAVSNYLDIVQNP
jgi:hypothetical protein